MRKICYLRCEREPTRGRVGYRVITRHDFDGRTVELLDVRGEVAVRIVLSGYDSAEWGRVSTPGLVLEVGATRLSVGFADSEVYNLTTDDLEFEMPGLRLHAELRGFGSEADLSLGCSWRGDALKIGFEEQSAEPNGGRYGELTLTPPLLDRLLVINSRACPICDGVSSSQDPDRAIRTYLASQRALSDGPPIPVAIVRDQVAATCCTAHGNMVRACDDVTVLENALEYLEIECETLGHPSMGLAEQDVSRARAQLEARIGTIERLLDRRVSS